MKIINATAGKIGTCIIGPKHFLNESIRLGEFALCIARDAKQALKPCIWLIGGSEQLIDYVSLARSQAEITEEIALMLLSILDQSGKKIPNSAIERLASVINMEVEDLKEILEIAQVCISAPIMGVHDYSAVKPKWLPKTTNHAPIH